MAYKGSGYDDYSSVWDEMDAVDEVENIADSVDAETKLLKAAGLRFESKLKELKKIETDLSKKVGELDSVKKELEKNGKAASEEYKKVANSIVKVSQKLADIKHQVVGFESMDNKGLADIEQAIKLAKSARKELPNGKNNPDYNNISNIIKGLKLALEE